MENSPPTLPNFTDRCYPIQNIAAMTSDLWPSMSNVLAAPWWKSHRASTVTSCVSTPNSILKKQESTRRSPQEKSSNVGRRCFVFCSLQVILTKPGLFSFGASGVSGLRSNRSSTKWVQGECRGPESDIVIYICPTYVLFIYSSTDRVD
jgi:hypothetical protein